MIEDFLGDIIAGITPDGPRRWYAWVIWGVLILGGVVGTVILVAQTF